MSITRDKLRKAVIIAHGTWGPAYLTKAAPRAIAQRNFPLLVRWCFLLFVTSIVFDISIVLSTAKLCGFLLVAIYFFYHNPLFGKRSFPPIPRVIFWFVIYVAVYALNGFFLPTERLDEFFTRLFTLIQFIVFLWIISDIMNEERMAKKALLVYASASVLLALGLVLSLPGFGVIGDAGTERTSVLGANANVTASFTALATVVLLGLWLNLSYKTFAKNLLMIGSIFVLSLATVYTGSRGGVLTLMIGLSVYLVPYWKRRWRLSAVILALATIAGLGYIAFSSPVFVERWLSYYKGEEQGSTRDRVYEEALDMISQRPFLGWQPVEFSYELGSRTDNQDDGRDAHNTYLHLFLEVGIIGAVPFLIGLWFCGQAAWNARNGNLGLLPLAIFVTILAQGMSLTSIYLKPAWFVLAVTIAVGIEKKRSSIIFVGRPVDNGLQTSSLVKFVAPKTLSTK